MQILTQIQVPILGGSLSGNQVYAIGKIATSPEAIAEFNTTHGSAITINDLVTDKKFQDQYYAIQHNI